MISIPVDNTVNDKAQAKPGPGDFSYDLDDDEAVHPPTDPAGDKAYAFPPIGGSFGVFGAPADGGASILAAPPATTTVIPSLVQPAYSMTGRSWNPTTRLNLYPWFKTPREGLDQNNVPAAAIVEDPQTPPAHGITMTPPTLANGVGAVSFSGPVKQAATVHLVVAIGSQPDIVIDIPVTVGMTATQIAAAVRNHINESDDGLEASGSGGSLAIESIETDVITKFQVSVT